MTSLLLVSNGHGESAIAGYIAREVARLAPQAVVEHFRLVGRDPADAWPPPVGPQRDMPSGGLVTYGDARNVIADLRAGLIGLSLRQFGFLGSQRARHVIVAVGDVYCLAACLLFARRPTIFVATARSEYVAGHSRLECAVARRAVATFARDEATAAALRVRGVRAQWVGNLMMDGLVPAVSNTLPVDSAALRFGVLPGSRTDAAANAGSAARRLRRIAARLGSRQASIQAFVSVADTVDAGALARAIVASGIEMFPTGATTGAIARGRAPETNLEMFVVSGLFAELLSTSDIVLGQAGTANEQAAGLGKPVIAACEPGRRPDRVGWYRKRQQLLLGDALLVLPDDDEAFAEGVIRLLDDSARKGRMSRTGRDRMGPPGGATRVAECIVALSGRTS